jgi:undecaprenyl-diphosphatase
MCGAAPLVLVVTVMLALWWSDPEGERPGGPLLPGSLSGKADGAGVARRRCVALAMAVGAAFVLTRLIAFAVDLPRPLGRESLQVPLEAGRWEDLVTGMTGFGAFPSDHAALFLAVATGMFGWGRRLGMTGLAVALLFSTARVAVGFHYPSDMVAGAAIGAGMGALALVLGRQSHLLLDGIVTLFLRHPALMYPLLFVCALDFTQHFRLVFSGVFYLLFRLLGGDAAT